MNEKQLVELIDKATKNFQGNTDALISAIGFLMVGRKFGWRVMFFMHSQATVRKYEKILGISYRDLIPEVGPLAKKAVAWQALQKVSNYWKAVKGEVAGIKSKEVLR